MITADAARQRLNDAMEGVRVAFARYRLDTLEGCPCCTNPKDAIPLRRPLSELSAQQLDHYASKALTTWGTVDEYRYFLPRIMELALTEEGRSWHGLEFWIIASKIHRGDWHKWPADERAAIEEYFTAVLICAFTLDDNPVGFGYTDSALDAFDELKLDPVPTLNAATEGFPQPALEHLVDTAESALSRDKVDESLWVTWLVSKAFSDRLEAAIFSEDPHENPQRLSYLHTMVEALARKIARSESGTTTGFFDADR